MSKAVRVFLIDEEILKTETPLNDNVGSEFIGPAIETSQDIYLQQLIGTELLDRLYDLIESGEITDEKYVNYKNLIDVHITNYLKYKVLSEITIPLAYKYRNTGVVQTNGDHYTNTTMRDAGLVQNHYEIRASFYAERMTSYLCANASVFPEWKSRRSGADLMADSGSYKTNIVL